MIKALSTAATGLEAQQSKIERISNDIANVNTDGYKRSRDEFQDLMYQTIKEPGGIIGVGSQSPVGIQTGLGVKVGASHKIFEQGPAKQTYHPYDLMITGRGFFPVQYNGEELFTRTGAFHVDREGRVVTATGARLIPEVVVPANASNPVINPQGEIKVTIQGQGEAVIGQLQLAMFQNEQGLNALGNGMYRPTVASGVPTRSIPGEAGTGGIEQGALEGSNVNIATSMVDMISTQRAYEMGAKVMKVADQMLGDTANIK